MSGINEPRYTSFVNGRWFPDMIGGKDTSGSSETYTGIFGFDITGITIEGVKEYSVATEDGGWLPSQTGYDRNNPAGDGSSIIAIRINDPNVIYMTHTKGGRWSKPVYGSETDRYSGNMLPIDALQILGI